MSACRQALRARPCGPPFGDGGAEHPLGGGEVGQGARRRGDRDRAVLLQGAVSGWVVGGAVLPAAPDDAAPGATEGAQRAGVLVAAGAGGGVAVLRPGVPVAGAVGQGAERAAQPLVAAPAEAGCLALAGLDRDGGLAGVGGERVTGRVARPAVADLGQQLGGGHDAAGVAEQREEDLAVGVLAHGGGDLLGELLDLLDQRLDRGDQGEHERAAGGELGLADAPLGRAPELREQLGGLLATGVALAREERAEALLAQAAHVGGLG